MLLVVPSPPRGFSGAPWLCSGGEGQGEGVMRPLATAPHPNLLPTACSLVNSIIHCGEKGLFLTQTGMAVLLRAEGLLYSH